METNEDSRTRTSLRSGTPVLAHMVRSKVGIQKSIFVSKVKLNFVESVRSAILNHNFIKNTMNLFRKPKCNFKIGVFGVAHLLLRIDPLS